MKVIKSRNIKYFKLCLISPITEIILNIAFLVTFICIMFLFNKEGSDYPDHQTLEFTKNYLNFESFHLIKTPKEFQDYIEILLKKIYTINNTDGSFPFIIPLSPLKLTEFSNNPSECSEHLTNTTDCNKNFKCIIDSLIKINQYECNKKYNSKNDNKTQENLDGGVFKSLVKKYPGYLGSYDILNGGNSIEMTYENYYLKDINKSFNNFINKKDLKFLCVQINFISPSNNNYIDVMMGIEMTSFYKNIKTSFSINAFNNKRPNSYFYFTTFIIFTIVVSLELIKYIYEINVKIIPSVHLFMLIYLVICILLIVFNILYLSEDKRIDFTINYNKFISHLTYLSIRKILKIINNLTLLCVPFKLISLISWIKDISEPFVKFLSILFRMLPGVILILIFEGLIILMFVFINYILYKDITIDFQSLYDSLFNTLDLNYLVKIFDNEGETGYFNSLTHSKYIIIILFLENLALTLSIFINIGAYVFLFKKALILESPKVENEYLNKLVQIEQKLEEGEKSEDKDLQKLKKQILWVSLTNKMIHYNYFLGKYDLLLFKNYNQIISFLKYLFAIKPELQFKNLNYKFNIVIEVATGKNIEKFKPFEQIELLCDWLMFVGCKIPVIVFSESNFAKPIKMKLNNIYNLVQFLHDENDLDKVLSEIDEVTYVIENNSSCNFIAEKSLTKKYILNDNNMPKSGSFRKKSLNRTNSNSQQNKIEDNNKFSVPMQAQSSSKINNNNFQGKLDIMNSSGASSDEKDLLNSPKG